MPPGYRVEYGGQFESEQRASETLVALGLLVLAGLVLLLVLAFGRVRDAVIVDADRGQDLGRHGLA